jgi:hypothetical protein
MQCFVCARVCVFFVRRLRVKDVDYDDTHSRCSLYSSSLSFWRIIIIIIIIDVLLNYTVMQFNKTLNYTMMHGQQNIKRWRVLASLNLRHTTDGCMS